MSAAKKNLTITESIVPFIFHGYTNSVTTCDCCGRDGLKVTVALWDAVEAQEVYFGTTCAARALSIGVKEVKHRADAAELARIEEQMAAFKAKSEAEGRAFREWMISRFTPVYYMNEKELKNLEIITTCRRAGLTIGQVRQMYKDETGAV